ncbi:hypothetical protein HD553DRAFT_125468 [Filobasidium floriforme]|uniref:uncharacterized protein n=1 Tax=Filobasidium floriforme TaxID=5210 RepID=UPI001E8E6EDC|nr:uncharacterized protein HD553DRAFT_125468 [Filobasidium floriforme]KAH8079918.1 hypothetical protein HD553DRAFT_125468 [Filobasidium floriforme]
MIEVCFARVVWTLASSVLVLIIRKTSGGYPKECVRSSIAQLLYPFDLKLCVQSGVGKIDRRPVFSGETTREGKDWRLWRSCMSRCRTERLVRADGSTWVDIGIKLASPERPLACYRLPLASSLLSDRLFCLLLDVDRPRAPAAFFATCHVAFFSRWRFILRPSIPTATGNPWHNSFLEEPDITTIVASERSSGACIRTKKGTLHR